MEGVFEATEPRDADNKVLESTVLQEYLRGYYCHPLRGVLNNREDFAQYDFRPWANKQWTAKHRLDEAHDFLTDAWRRDGPPSDCGSVSPRFDLWLGPKLL